MIKRGYNFTVKEDRVSYENTSSKKEDASNSLELIAQLSDSKSLAMNYINTLIRLEVSICFGSTKEFIYTVYDCSEKVIFMYSLTVENTGDGLEYISKKFIDNPRFENIVFRCDRKNWTFTYIGSDKKKQGDFDYIAKELVGVASPWD